MSFKDTLNAHAKANKITPGQQVNLLIYYLGLRMLFPEITFEQYLERTLLVAGATDANRQFPKDALDHHCPNKGGAWAPNERIDMMLTYLELCEILAADKLSLPFDDFLTTEAPIYKNAPPAASQPAGSATPPAGDAGVPAPPSAPAAAPAPRTRRKKDQEPGNAVALLVEGSRWNYRVPNGPVLPVTIILVGQNEWAVRSDSGEEFTTTEPQHFEPFQAETPAPPPTTPSYAQGLVLTPAQGEAVENLLVLTAPLASRSIGDVLESYDVRFSETDYARFDVVNAQPKPYVDAYFCRGTTTMAEAPPRETSIYGQYDFNVEGRTYSVTVTRVQ